MSQRFWNIAGVIMYGVMLPLSCLFIIVLGEPIPFALFAIWITFLFIEQSAMEQLRRKNAQ
mgnify:CR=1 FL=1